MFHLKCQSLSPRNKIPVGISVLPAPELTELVMVKEADKAIEETHKVIREAGYALKYSKAGVDLSVFLTNEQAAELFNPDILKQDG